MFIKEVFAQLQKEVHIESEFDLAKNPLTDEPITLGSFTTLLIPLAFSIAAMMVVFYFIIGAFEMITSQGDKAHIVSARAKIYHSIIGLTLLIALFLVMQVIIWYLGFDGVDFNIFKNN